MDLRCRSHDKPTRVFPIGKGFWNCFAIGAHVFGNLGDQLLDAAKGIDVVSLKPGQARELCASCHKFLIIGRPCYPVGVVIIWHLCFPPEQTSSVPTYQQPDQPEGPDKLW